MVSVVGDKDMDNARGARAKGTGAGVRKAMMVKPGDAKTHQRWIQICVCVCVKRWKETREEW